MIDVNTLLERAHAATGLADFGEESFREGLGILVESLNREGNLNAVGVQVCEGQIVDLLSNRLQVEDWYRRHPEIDAQEIVAPLIGLGLPRTGSTALACLLGEDPAVRCLRTWEAGSPCPPPTTATAKTDPRIAAAQARIEQQALYYPRMRSMLPQSADAPMECQSFMGYDFKTQLFFTFADIPTYRDWLVNKADLVPTYRYVKRILKLLQWRCPPNRWRLKNPSHAMFIGALAEVFPDARFWMTHRSIESVIPSVSDLYHEMMKSFSDDIDKANISKMNEDFWDEAIHRVIAFRDAGNDAKFFDIHFRPFMRDPIAAIEELYAFLGEDLSDEARRRMEAWRADTPRDKHGEHSYDAGQFGIDLAELRDRFAFYSDRFAVEPLKV